MLEGAVSAEGFRAAYAGAGVFVLEGGGTTLMGAEPVVELRVARADGGDPFAGIRAVLGDASGIRWDSSFPFSFRAGLVGYVGYECGQMLERLPGVARPSLGMPDLAFALHHWVLATRDGKTWLSVLAGDAGAARAVRERVVTRLASAPSVRPARVAAGAVRAWLEPDEYVARVRAAREHILDGDAFEICVTSAFDAPFDPDGAWALFRSLQRDNPAPYAAFLQLEEGTIVSSSPERFLTLSADRVAETRPIKGTRPRGATREEDARLAAELATSEKDRAENAMIVDLARNDLGKVCRVGTVTTPALFAVESYATVHQLVSTVRGVLADEHDAVDLLRACFPPGSMTGAPKIEAMSILERLEPVERGPYAGALGWIDLGGAMDLSVVIRTVVLRDGVARFGAGGAVTADSDAEAEHAEMMQKTRALRAALGIA
ncbi:MAG: aminodeoxychorismate synthase component I [Labilithrix sp.]|nr:aminodeoxychorismate synthase component I [Labilithrix sp.]MCW5816102.1 aminodeoxychorismate synthase component I [Labilithrix sp.]